MPRIGIDFGGTKIAYGLFDDQMQCVDRLRVKTDAKAQPDAVMDAMQQDIRALLARNGMQMHDLDGVGIGFPSHVDYDAGSIVIVTNLPLWEDVPLRDAMQERLGVRVALDNDTNCAALAEHRHGAGQGAEHMVYVTVSTGIGCGYIINGKMYRGAHGFAGELGQMFVSDTLGYGTQRTNAGTIQSIASGPQLARYARELIENGEQSEILKLAGCLDDICTEHIGAALQSGDALAAQIVDFAALQLGRMFVNLFELLDIECIVYGGGVTKIGARLTDAMIEHFYAMSNGARKRPIQFHKAALGDDAGLLGAALLV